MFSGRPHDLHMHLNGSFSLNFLAEVAQRNQVEAVYEELVKAKAEYLQALQAEEKEMKHERSIAFIWKQFGLIHQIIQKCDDVALGVVDVVKNSKAEYLEIRSTPKEIEKQSWVAYVNAFVVGLQIANDTLSNKKAKGLLTLDRVLATEAFAYQVIDKAVEIKQKTGLLVGIDLAGDPIKTRSLSGDALARVLKYALSKPIGLALHMGEVDTLVESKDTDIILNTLAEWQKQNPKENTMKGKVRLGHVIYTNQNQKDLIKKLECPIEVCPSCHEKINWWPKNSQHPVEKIYSMWSQPIVVGTDDELIFNGDAVQENNTVMNFTDYPFGKDLENANLHQSQFRFV